MFWIYRLGIIVAACAVAAAAGLSVALLATPHSSPSSPIGAAVAATAAVATAATAAPQLPTAPELSAAAPELGAAAQPAPIPLRSAAEILQQVKATVARMRSGRLEGSIDYGNGDRSVASVRFELGDLQSKFEIATTYTGASGRHTAQRTTINDRTWQRQGDAAWLAQPAEESAGGELQAFLPEFGTITDVEALDDQEGLLALHWVGANGADTTLLIDPDTNIPRQLRQLSPGTSTIFTVIYQSWNVPVDINPPN